MIRVPDKFEYDMRFGPSHIVPASYATMTADEKKAFHQAQEDKFAEQIREFFRFAKQYRLSPESCAKYKDVVMTSSETIEEFCIRYIKHTHSRRHHVPTQP